MTGNSTLSTTSSLAIGTSSDLIICSLVSILPLTAGISFWSIDFTSTGPASLETASFTSTLTISRLSSSTVSITIKNIAKTANAAAKERITLSSERFPNVFLTREDSFNLRISVFLAFIFSCPLGGS